MVGRGALDLGLALECMAFRCHVADGCPNLRSAGTFRDEREMVVPTNNNEPSSDMRRWNSQNAEGGVNMRGISSKSALRLMVVVFVCVRVEADGGFHAFNRAARIFEPNQRAIIAWNGWEEILLLSADIRASEKTQALRVVPFPSEPKVKEGDLDAFRQAVKIINRHIKVTYSSSSGGGGGGFGGGGTTSGPTPAGEVTFHDTIGGHDITVAKVNDGANFQSWVKDYLTRQGLPESQISEGFLKIVQTYLEDRYRWFVFDVVELGDKEQTLKPIQYRFNTHSLFYPLRISSTQEGSTWVDLTVISSQLLHRFSGLSRKHVRKAHQPFQINSAELKMISLDMGDLFREDQPTYLRIWYCTGMLSSFDKDLIVGS